MLFHRDSSSQLCLQHVVSLSSPFIKRTSEPLLLSTALKICRSIWVKHGSRINIAFHLPFISVLTQRYVPSCHFNCLFTPRILQIPRFSDLRIVISRSFAHTVLNEKKSSNEQKSSCASAFSGSSPKRVSCCKHGTKIVSLSVFLSFSGWGAGLLT